MQREKTTRTQHRHQRDASELLSTKLTPPRLSTSVIARKTLLTRLDAALDYKLTLLSTPAGFGKTTLMSAWIAS